jgi:hypothetical protein
LIRSCCLLWKGNLLAKIHGPLINMALKPRWCEWTNAGHPESASYPVPRSQPMTNYKAFLHRINKTPNNGHGTPMSCPAL